MTATFTLGTMNFRLPETGLPSLLEPDLGHKFTSTKIICTVGGPQSRSPEALEELLNAGMTVCRFDFSFGDLDYHLVTLKNLQTALTNTNKMCGVMLDTQGSEITVINRPADFATVELTAGQEIIVTCDSKAKFDGKTIPISLESWEGQSVDVNGHIFVGQYLFTGSESSSAYLTVQRVEGLSAVCLCNNACVLEGPQLTVNLEKAYRKEIFTKKDAADIRAWAAATDNYIDFVSMSFCHDAADVEACRAVLSSLGLGEVAIIAKLEDQDGLLNAEEIIDAADGILFSRGNLGVDVSPEKLFLAQKVVVGKCNLAGKFVIVTRVVDTMSEAPRPTRAEATDVANLVLDGADAIMLGAETFRGKYAAETCRTVLSICRQAELHFDNEHHYVTLVRHMGGYKSRPSMPQGEALASSAVRATTKLAAGVIVAITKCGETARILANYKPEVPIIAAVLCEGEEGVKPTMYVETRARQALLYRGVIPMVVYTDGGAFSEEETLQHAAGYAESLGMLVPGNRVVVCRAPNADISGSLKILLFDDMKNERSTKSMSQFFRTSSGADLPQAGVGSLSNILGLTDANESAGELTHL